MMNYSGNHHQMLPYSMRGMVVDRRRWNGHVELAPNCPRCDSSNTKFCYYNNYSLTQPRYFCKGCRRYWTKGGSLRNVPVGGGSRKSRRGKSSSKIISTATATVLRPPPGCSLRPDLALDGMVGSSCPSITDDSPPNGGGGGGGGTVIDLAVLYSKYLNQCPQLEFNEESQAFTGGLDACYDQILSSTTTTSSSSSSSSTDVMAENMFLSWSGSMVPGLVCQEAKYEELGAAVAGDNVMLGQNLISMEDWSLFDESIFEGFYSM